MSFSSLDAKSPNAGRSIERIISAVDKIIEIFFIQRAIILKNNQLAGRRGTLNIYANSLKLVIIITSHAYLFYFIGHSTKGISLIDFFMSGFVIWFVFSAGFKENLYARRGAGASNAAQTSVEILLSGLIWELVKILVAIFVLVALFYVVDDKRVWPGFPNVDILALLFLVLISAALGTGFGLVLSSLGQRWPVFKRAKEILRWGLFVTCGLWGANAEMAAGPQALFQLNPLYGLLQHSRKAFYSGYSDQGSSLLYPIGLSLGLLTIGLALQRRERKGMPHA